MERQLGKKIKMPGSIFAVIKIWTDSGKPAKKSMDSLLSRINERGWQERSQKNDHWIKTKKTQTYIIYIYFFRIYVSMYWYINVKGFYMLYSLFMCNYNIWKMCIYAFLIYTYVTCNFNTNSLAVIISHLLPHIHNSVTVQWWHLQHMLSSYAKRNVLYIIFILPII